MSSVRSNPSPPSSGQTFRSLLLEAIKAAQKDAKVRGHVLSLNAIERRAGFATGTLSKIMKGKRTQLHEDTVNKLAQALGLSFPLLWEALQRDLTEQKKRTPTPRQAAKTQAFQRDVYKALLEQVWDDERHSLADAYTAERVLETTGVRLTTHDPASQFIARALLDLARMMHRHDDDEDAIRSCLEGLITTWQSYPPASRPGSDSVAA